MANTWTVAELPWHNALDLSSRAHPRAAGAPSDALAYRRWVDEFGRDGVRSAVAALGLAAEDFRGIVENDGPAPEAETPEWVRRADLHLALGREAASDRETHLARADSMGFLRPALDLVHGYQRALHARVELAMHGHDTRIARLPHLLAHDWPVEELSLAMTSTMMMEMNVAQISGRVSGDQSEERFLAYLGMLSEDGFQRELWSEYVVLLHRVDDLLHRWAQTRAEFAEHLVADLAGLDALSGSVLGELTGVDFGSGYDRRRGGLRTAVASFGDTRIVHRPWSLDAQETWGRIVDWFNDQGPAHRITAPRVLGCGDHGWSEFVEHLPCPPEQADAFYWRLGAVHALSHSLSGGAPDQADVIAAGAHPVLVDAEAILRGTWTGPERPAAPGAEKGKLRDGGSGGPDTGNEGDDGQDDEDPDDELDGLDDELDDGRHRPYADGVEFDPSDHSEAFEAGFVLTYRSLFGDRSTWLSEQGPLRHLDSAQLRQVLYPESLYTALLAEGDRPEFLRDGRDRDRALARVALGADGDQPWEALLPSELTDLRNGDLPHFSGVAGSTDLEDSRGHLLPDVLDQPPAESVRQRLLSLSGHDLSDRVTSLRRAAEPQTPRPGDARTLALTDPPAGVEDSLNASLEIARGLLGRSTPDSFGLCSDAAGVGMFLSRLHEVTGDRDAGRAGERSARSTARQVLEMARSVDQQTGNGGAEAPDPGLLGQIGGAVYHLAHAYAVHGTPEWPGVMEVGLAALRRCIDQSTREALGGGLAGTVLAVLSVHAVHPGSDALDVARQAASKLLDQLGGLDRLDARRPAKAGAGPASGPLSGFRPGMASGTTGVVHALLCLNSAAPAPRYQEALEALLRHEHGLLERTAAMDPSWCRGITGIGLSRIALLESSAAPSVRSTATEDLAVIESELTALHLPSSGVFRSAGDNGLCHGDLGNLEFLLAAAERRNDTGTALRLRRAVAALCARGRTHGWRIAPLDTQDSLGLMYGLSGIGYNLLRLALPERVPSVLMLGAP
ncbi:type 2 lanthipeptide synthetase LanM family protein [Nocardiopsis valliformis]|uniref:type 2 lanthipeptide synthetase LanM family protein n=1 Tax=Nocardiopsis valliformis TaxID=239974 RepID=UPI00034C021F|nr:type 2 lanthipeptide synthetase LanM family protein [Nocardiopsis valliformis]